MTQIQKPEKKVKIYKMFTICAYPKHICCIKSDTSKGSSQVDDGLDGSRQTNIRHAGFVYFFHNTSPLLSDPLGRIFL